VGPRGGLQIFSSVGGRSIRSNLASGRLLRAVSNRSPGGRAAPPRRRRRSQRSDRAGWRLELALGVDSSAFTEARLTRRDPCIRLGRRRTGGLDASGPREGPSPPTQEIGSPPRVRQLWSRVSTRELGPRSSRCVGRWYGSRTYAPRRPLPARSWKRVISAQYVFRSILGKFAAYAGSCVANYHPRDLVPP
jgi:hypothetical protein